METVQSLTGIGGGPLGTERPSAISPTSLPAGGELFAREVERATERSRGDGLRAERLDELARVRRETRRAGFGGPRPGDETTVNATAASEPSTVDTPPNASPLAAEEAPAVATDTELPFTQPEGVARAEAAPAASEPRSTTASPALESPANTPAAVQTTPASAMRVEAGSPAAPRVEARPIEVLPGTRTTPERPQRSQSAPSRPAADAAALERAQDIVEQIRAHFAPNLKRLVLDLRPAELGRLSVQLAWRGGKLAAIVRADEPETLELLAGQAGELRSLFARSGVPADELRFELGFERGASAPPRAGTPTPLSSERAERSSAESRPASTGLVDTYA